MSLPSKSLQFSAPTSVLAPADRTATATSAAIDLQAYDGEMVLNLHSAAGTGTTPTLDVKVQDCDTEAGTYADVSGMAFAQVTTTAACADLVLPVRELKRYIKVVATIAGTSPHFLSAVTLRAVPKYGS